MHYIFFQFPILQNYINKNFYDAGDATVLLLSEDKNDHNSLIYYKGIGLKSNSDFLDVILFYN